MNDVELIHCSDADLDVLATLNKQLIVDEKSDNKMDVLQLKERMAGFIHSEYDAYLFMDANNIIGYALVKKTQSPLYLRQFFICTDQRQKGYGKASFYKLMQTLDADAIDIEVLCWNSVGKAFWDSLGFNERSIYMRYES